jgi:hypothetical protein
MHIPSFVSKIWCRPVLYGHNHYYQRTYPLAYIDDDDDDDDELVGGNEDGAINVVVVVNWRNPP